MSRLSAALTCSSVWFGALTVAVPQTPPASAAQQVWEDMIAAKGGHARLRAVRSFVVAYRKSGSSTRPDVAPTFGFQQIALLPYGFWVWADFRPGSFGVTSDVFNFESHRNWYLWGGRDLVAQSTPSGMEYHFRGELETAELVYFLETSMMQPTVIGSEFHGRTATVDVQTELFASAKYTVDSKTHLPTAVTLIPFLRGFDGTEPPRPAPEVATTYKFDGVVTVDGIQLPKRVHLSGWGEPVYVVDPDLDPRMFEGPPQTTDQDEWRKWLRSGRTGGEPPGK